MKSKHKKIAISIGSVLAASAIVIPISIVFSGNKPQKTKKNKNGDPITAMGEEGRIRNYPSVGQWHYSNDELRSKIYGVIKKYNLKNLSFTKDILSSEENVDIFTKLLSDFLKDGILNIKQEDLKPILKKINLSPELLKLFNQLAFKDGKINLELLDLFFNKGIAKIQEEKYKDQLSNILNIFHNLIPKDYKSIISKDIIKKIIISGISEKEFIDLVTKIVNSSSFGLGGTLMSWTSVPKDLKNIYSWLPLIQKGILNASVEDWRKMFFNFKNITHIRINAIIKTITFSDLIPLIPFIEKYKKNIHKDWTLIKVFKNMSNQINRLATKNIDTNQSDIDEISSAFYNFFNKGLNSITEKQGKYISNLFEWVKNYKQGFIYSRDLNNFKEGIKELIKEAKNNNKYKKPIDFIGIDNSISLEEVIINANKIKIYKEINIKKENKISSDSLYKSLSYYDKITSKNIEDDPGIFSGVWPWVKSSSQKILSKYFDKNKKKLPKKHPDIEKVFNEYKKDSSVNENNAYIWWDKIIDAASSIETYDQDGKKITINWEDAFKKLYAEDWYNESYTFYKKVVKAIKKIIVEKKYYKTDSPTDYEIFKNEDFDREFGDAIKTFKIKPILDKIDFLISKGFYYGTKANEMVNLRDKIKEYAYKNINNYNFHKRRKNTIYDYREKVKEVLSKYRIKKEGKILPINTDFINFENQEGVKEIYMAANKFLYDNKNNLFSSLEKKLELSKEKIDMIIPKIPPKDFAYEINKKVLERDPTHNLTTESKMIYLFLNNKKTITNFIMNGYPTSKTEEENFEKMIKDMIVVVSSKIPLLKSFGKNPELILDLIKSELLDDISDIIRRYRQN